MVSMESSCLMQSFWSESCVWKKAGAKNLLERGVYHVVLRHISLPMISRGP
jgi:hypothetical protein